MQIAYLMIDNSAKTPVLTAFADALIQQGKKPIGLVQVEADTDDLHRCQMDLKVLPDGPTVCISQSLGRGSTGCRLDPGALESAVVTATKSIDKSADVLIINKFGRLEAEGHGGSALICDAIDQNIPVVVGLSGLNKDDFLAFSAGLAIEVLPDLNALQNWLQTATAKEAA